MRAAVTEARETIRIIDVPDPGEPGEGEVVVRPEAVGLCGSDFHYFLGHIGSVEESKLYPRIFGHEAAGILDAVGPGCPPELRTGERVAMWPLVACGHCYPCRIGRGNACVNISLIGVHTDGALQDRLRIPATQVFPVGDRDPAAAALIEPVSIAVRAVVRGRVAEGEKVVVFGAGPIGQAIAVAAIDSGASVLLVDRVQSRLERGKTMGADVLAVAAGRGSRRGCARMGRQRRARGGIRGDGRRPGRTDGCGARRTGGPGGDRRARPSTTLRCGSPTSPSRRSTSSA